MPIYHTHHHNHQHSHLLQPFSFFTVPLLEVKKEQQEQQQQQQQQLMAASAEHNVVTGSSVSVVEALSANDSSSVSACDSHHEDDDPSSSPLITNVLGDLPDIEDLNVGMCMNTGCGANYNRSCLLSELDLLDDDEEEMLPPLSAMSTSPSSASFGLSMVKSELAMYMSSSSSHD